MNILKEKSTFIMKVNGKDHKDTASSLRRQAIRLLCEEKLAAIKTGEKHLHKVVCIHNTLDLLVKVVETQRRSRKRGKMASMSTVQNEKNRQKVA